ncbi:MAG: shikimate dehydrogenase [Vampirovibrio sp.]|nr:shikimate dehydrogenase [Vampirovibrio sp.]
MMNVGIIGYPLTFTLSGTLHHFLMQAMCIEGDYRVYPTPAERLEEVIQQLQQKGLRGLNVTIPHKVNVLPLCNTLEASADLIQAVNTLIFPSDSHSSSGPVGENTDIHGFLAGIPEPVVTTLSNRPSLILGAGGAARAVIAGLIQHQVPALTLAVRNPEKAKETLVLAESIKEKLSAFTVLNVVPLSELGDISGYELVVNTTPIGQKEGETLLSPDQINALLENTLVYDLLYQRSTTPLMATAQQKGLQTVGGLPMLVHQGVRSFELWSGQTVPENIIKQCLDHLAVKSMMKQPNMVNSLLDRL